ncbi:MAG: class I SAM-dependent methyltransferase [Chitinophagaceae bacterium]|nr:class I SAM-dependent methyltransferase [Chitinophagaceae bacterium]
MIKQLVKKIFGLNRFNSKNYWESRYAAGGNSGDGSYGRLAVFKSEFINNLLNKKGIISSIEFGCGDGHQLSSIHYKKYIGLDVSETIIDKCKEKFSGDQTKSFFAYRTGDLKQEFKGNDLALSLDVLYHVVEESVFTQYIIDLFSASEKYVLVYSTNFYKEETIHVLHRKFTDYVEKYCPEWKLVEETKNPYPGNGEQESMADFFLFEKTNL